MLTKTLQLPESLHEKLKGHAAANGDAKLFRMFAAYQAGWVMLTFEQQHQAFRGEICESPAVCGERTGTIQGACNNAQRAAMELDEMVDQFVADGKLTKGERNKIRRKAKALEEAACGVGVHANEPIAAPA